MIFIEVTDEKYEDVLAQAKLDYPDTWKDVAIHDNVRNMNITLAEVDLFQRLNIIWIPTEEKESWDLLAKKYEKDFENQILFGNYNPTKS